MKTVLSIPNNIIRFFREVAAELKSVEWLNRSQVTSFTITVISITVLIVIIVSSMDGIMVFLRGILLDRF